jgi:hypothetical protein
MTWVNVTYPESMTVTKLKPSTQLISQNAIYFVLNALLGHTDPIPRIRAG